MQFLEDFLINNNLRFDIALPTGQEWDFHITIAITGGVFVYDPTLIYYYRDHQSPDRISQVNKNSKTILKRTLKKVLVTYPKIISSYKNDSLYSPTKNLMRKILSKNEIKFIKAKDPKSAQDIRKIRRSIDPPWKIFLTDIRYIRRRLLK